MNFILPLPPGINRTYGINTKSEGNPMYKKPRVRNWEDDAGFEVLRQLTPEMKKLIPLKGDVEMGIRWYYKYNRDIDAGLKVLLDLFEKQNVYLNDRQVRRFKYYEIFRDPKHPRVEVEIYAMD